MTGCTEMEFPRFLRRVFDGGAERCHELRLSEPEADYVRSCRGARLRPLSGADADGKTWFEVRLGEKEATAQ
ncbi:MAG TPA: hypothetical protein PK597_03785 [Oscillospiraceae bacterium]|nr:hypothetical protein [Oscillospiraceae bacterium]